MAIKNKIWTIIDMIKWGTEFFEKKNIEAPRLNIELLLCHALNAERINLYTKFDKPLAESELACIKELVVRRAENEPLQYITGYSDFFNVKIKIDKRALIPRPETEILVETACKQFPENSNIKILDIGCGSGCIALALAKYYSNSNVTGLDISNDSIALSKENKEYTKISNVNFFEADILKVCPKQKYDIVVSNPPYICSNDMATLPKDVLNYEPHTALTDGKDGLTFYKRFAEIFQLILNDNSVFILEISYLQKEDMYEIFKDFNIEVIEDYSHIGRVVVGRKKI